MLPALGIAGVGHEECALCHGVHTGQGPVILTEPLNTTTINPVTGQPLGRMDAICMACHAEEPAGAGYRPVKMEETHPSGLMPVKVHLPAEAKGFRTEEEKLTCCGCHDPHPSNPNYMYLQNFQ